MLPELQPKFSEHTVPEAHEPPELRAGSRDAVRLLVSTKSGHHHSRFTNLANFLRRGDLLVVNRSATLGATQSRSHTDLLSRRFASSAQTTLNLRYHNGLRAAEVGAEGPLPAADAGALVDGGA